MIADRIRRKREQRGYSQEYMAQRLGISPSAYCRMENGARVEAEQLRGIAEVLETGIEELLHPETVVMNMGDPQNGSGGYHIENHQNGVSEETLKRIEDRHEAHVKELQQVNARLMEMNTSLMALVERLAAGK